GRLAVAAERHVAEPGARQRAEVMRVARERLLAVGDRALVVLGHVADGRALVPALGERGSPRDHAGEDGLGAGEVPALHDGDALAKERVDLGAATLRQSVAAVEKVDGEVLAVDADVTGLADVERYAKAAVDRFGAIDVFFNNAGVLGALKPLVDYPEETFDRVIAVNL